MPDSLIILGILATLSVAVAALIAYTGHPDPTSSWATLPAAHVKPRMILLTGTGHNATVTTVNHGPGGDGPVTITSVSGGVPCTDVLAADALLVRVAGPEPRTR